MAAEAKFEFGSTASHGIKHGKRVTKHGEPFAHQPVFRKASELNCAGLSQDRGRWQSSGHDSSLPGPSPPKWALQAVLPLLPQPGSVGIGTANSSLSLKVCNHPPFKALTWGPWEPSPPVDYLAQGHIHIPPLLSSASQRCEPPINGLYLPFPEKTNREIV